MENRRIPPQRREKKARLRRPGANNLNRTANIIRSVESASLVLNSPKLFSGEPESSVKDLDNEETTKRISGRNEKNESIFSADSSESQEDRNLPKTDRSPSSSKIPTGTSELRTKMSKSKAFIDTVTRTFTGEFQELPPIEGNTVFRSTGSTHATISPLQDPHACILPSNDLTWDDSTDNIEQSVAENRIRVENSIHFMKSSRNVYSASIKIENLSKFHTTFCVRSSNPGIFLIQPKVDLIKPGRTGTVSVSTNPDCKFSTIVQETFKIFATPIYSSTLQDLEKLESLWNMYGTEYFPLIGAEEHKISFLCPFSPSSSLLDNVVDNNLWHRIFRRFHPPPQQMMPTDQQIQTFYDSWPVEDDDHSFMTSMNQIHGWKLHFQKISQLEKQRIKMRRILTVIILLTFSTLVIYCAFFSTYYPPDDWRPLKYPFSLTNSLHDLEEGVEEIPGQPKKTPLSFLISYSRVLSSQIGI